MHISRWPAILAGCLLATSGVLGVSNDTAPADTNVSNSTLEEEAANVEQVPPPAPLITESAHKGYRMPGLYGMGSQPFYLEIDPVTGNVDFTKAGSSQTDNNHRYSSKVTDAVEPLHDQEYDYEEVAMRDEESDPIDRKDTLGPNRPNDIKQQEYSPYFQSNNFREKIPPKEKFPLISSSYANTKVQGMGIVKQEPQKPITISTPPPSYFTFKPSGSSSTTEKILDFWPLKSSTPAPTAQENYDYYDETPAMTEEETEEEEALNTYETSTAKLPATTQQSVVYSKPFIPTALPVETDPQTTIPTRLMTSTARPVSISQPYGFEEPFRPIYGPGEGDEEPITRPDVYNPTENRPQPPSIYNLPPKVENTLPLNNQQRPVPTPQRPDGYVQPLGEVRPTQNNINFNTPQLDNRPSIFNPPPIPIYNQQPGPQRRPLPPSIRPQPPKYDQTRFQEEVNEGEGSTLPSTIRTPQIDSQGWKQATFTQTPPPAISTTRVQFPDDDTSETYTPSSVPSSPSTFKQPLPQGYEPQRPVQFRPPQVRRPTPEMLAGLRPPNEGQVRPNFEGQRPQFERPIETPTRNQFEGRPVFDGSMRPPPIEGGQIRPPFDGPPIRPPQSQLPMRRWERPPGPNFPPPPPKFAAIRPPMNQEHKINRPGHQELPNILPQFRPNARISFQVDGKPNHGHPNPRPPAGIHHVNRRQQAFHDRPYPHPQPLRAVHHAEEQFSSPPPQAFQNNGPPLVGRRVGSQVSTLQMMQHGVLPRPSSREDAPHPNPRPPVVTPYEVRPSKYGTLQEGTEDKPVFVVYANSGENQQPAGDVLIGTHGPHKPLPPSHLTEEEPVLNNNKRPQMPAKTDFPYALEKPTDEVNKVVNSEDLEKDEEINIIPNLQDYMPFAIKSTSTKAHSTSAPTTALTSSYYKNPELVTSEAKPTVQSFIRPQSNSNEFTVSAVMHTGNHPGGQGTGSVMVVAPQHRNPAQESLQTTSSASPESFNFQAPFHASANVAPSPGNGWSAVKGSSANKEEALRPGTVDRADISEELSLIPTSTGNSNSKFDIENFKPELIGGFQPLYSFPSETAEKKLEEKQTPSEREEKKL